MWSFCCGCDAFVVQVQLSSAFNPSVCDARALHKAHSGHRGAHSQGEVSAQYPHRKLGGTIREPQRLSQKPNTSGSHLVYRSLGIVMYCTSFNHSYILKESQEIGSLVLPVHNWKIQSEHKMQCGIPTFQIQQRKLGIHAQRKGVQG